MTKFYAPMLLAIASNVLYHLFLKMINGNINPVLALFFTYITAALISIVIFFIYPNETNFSLAFKEVNWPCYALGVSIVFLEVGFILAYRVGWNLSIAAVFSNSMIAIALVPIGVFFFKEQISPMKILGLVLCVVGLILVNKK